MIEDSADDDGVVGGIVVSEVVAGMGATPGELRAAHQAMEEAAVQVFEEFVQMMVAA
jgi:hypothetical protein